MSWNAWSWILAGLLVAGAIAVMVQAGGAG